MLSLEDQETVLLVALEGVTVALRVIVLPTLTLLSPEIVTLETATFEGFDEEEGLGELEGLEEDDWPAGWDLTVIDLDADLPLVS